MKTLALIPARMDSTRFPGKVLASFAGQPLLSILLHRLRRCEAIDSIELLTTNRPIDRPLRDWSEAVSVSCRASLLPVNDVLGRFRESALASSSSLIVRANGDSPLLDPRLISQAVHEIESQPLDCVTGKSEYTGLPSGLLGDVLTVDALLRLDPGFPGNREHVTPEVFQEESAFSWRAVTPELIPNSLQALCNSGMSLTIDHPSDLPTILNAYNQIPLD